MSDVPFSCSCGAVKGTLSDASPRTGSHAICHCKSCRQGEVFAGSKDPAPNPVTIFQTSPHRLHIAEGQDRIAVFSFGEKNLLRWYASCCGKTLFNTPRNPRISFVGISTDCLSDTDSIGPVIGRGFIPVAGGKTRHEGLAKLIWGGLSRVVVNRVTGRWRDTPLFDVSRGTPIKPVQVVPAAARKALLDSAK